jgi:hypothetical protein
VSEKPYELAYEASTRAIDDQAKVVDGLRTRAGTLLAAAAVVLSFFAAQALRSASVQDHAPILHSISYTSGAIAAFAGVAVLTVATLLPTGFRFSVDAGRMLEIIERRAFDDPVGSIEAYQVVARQHRWLLRSEPAADPCAVVVSPRRYGMSRRGGCPVDRRPREKQAVSRNRCGRKPKPPLKPPPWGDLSLPRE